MSLATINIFDERTALQSNPPNRQNVVRDLTKSVQRSLIEDPQQQAEKLAAEIGACLEPATGDMDLRGEYSVLKRWYRHVSSRSPKRSPADMDKVTKDYTTLYHRKDPETPGQPLSTHIDPFTD